MVCLLRCHQISTGLKSVFYKMTTKTISLKQFGLLKKFMQTTMSGADAEKLFALKKSSDIMSEAGIDWNHILDRCVKVELEIESFETAEAPRGNVDDGRAREAERAAMARKVGEAFDDIEATDPKGTWADFIADLKRQWDEKGRLSGPQMEALLKGARNAREKRR